MLDSSIDLSTTMAHEHSGGDRGYTLSDFVHLMNPPAAFLLRSEHVPPATRRHCHLEVVTGGRCPYEARGCVYEHDVGVAAAIAHDLVVQLADAYAEPHGVGRWAQGRRGGRPGWLPSHHLPTPDAYLAALAQTPADGRFASTRVPPGTADLMELRRDAGGGGGWAPGHRRRRGSGKGGSGAQARPHTSSVHTMAWTPSYGDPRSAAATSRRIRRRRAAPAFVAGRLL